MSDNIIDLISRQRRGGPGGPPPPQLPSPKLTQTDYIIKVVDKVTKQEVVVEKRGHIVVTANNIVLFDENQEMLWGIPNDEAVISFERKGNGNTSTPIGEDEIEIEDGVDTLEIIEVEDYDPDDNAS